MLWHRGLPNFCGVDFHENCVSYAPHSDARLTQLQCTPQVTEVEHGANHARGGDDKGNTRRATCRWLTGHHVAPDGTARVPTSA